MTTATMTTGETIKIGDEYTIYRGFSDSDGEEVYMLAEFDGYVIEEDQNLRRLIKTAQGMTNGGLAQEVMTASEATDGLGDDTILGSRKLWRRVCQLGDSTKPEAEAELREILARVKAATAA